MTVAKASGSFIQGWVACSYTDDQWEKEFGFMKEAGIQKLIVQTTVDEEGTDSTPPSSVPTSMLSLYPSQIPGMTYQGAVASTVESILRQAQANGVSVYLGLNSNLTAWKAGDLDNRPALMDPNWGPAEAARGNAIADELSNLYLAKYPQAFAGWYWPWEIDNSSTFLSQAGQAALTTMMNVNLNHLMTIGGGLPVMISPFFNPDPNVSSMADAVDFWTAMFAQLDGFGANGIFSPQDGIGAGAVQLADLAPWYGALAGAAASQPGIKFWANCETFQGNPGTTAPLTRVVQQFQAVAPYVSDIVTFDYTYYDSPLRVDQSIQDAWVQYYQTGKLPPATQT